MSHPFHAHLDECERCRAEPCNLCPTGARLLVQTAPHSHPTPAKMALRAALLPVDEVAEALPTDLEMVCEWCESIEHWVDESVPEPALSLILDALVILNRARATLTPPTESGGAT